ncbi:IclR family transcriptional regulator domain-containing protein [Streptomyces lavendulocolor]|uniref:IclR family transcriptional regulator domain-containing protein n=1 Tax=Streptomyces lavendulocolor TaxID=67316 RepID=UPI003C2E5CFA
MSKEVRRTLEEVLADAALYYQRPIDNEGEADYRLVEPCVRRRAPATAVLPSPRSAARQTAVDVHADRHTLDSLCTQIVLSPQAVTRLAEFAYSPFDRVGAFAFACVLHLAGDGEGATFWWQYAAGAEESRAAYCLMLDHRRRGEFADAQVWEDRLTDEGYELTPVARPKSATSQMPGAAALAVQLSDVVLRTAREEHEELGEVPVPTAEFAEALRDLNLPAATETAAQDGGSRSGTLPLSPWTPHVEPSPGLELARPWQDPIPSREPHPAVVRLWTPPTSLWTPPGLRSPEEPMVDETLLGMRVLDILTLIASAPSPVRADQAAMAAGVRVERAGELLVWLDANSLVSSLEDGTYGRGPLLEAAERGEDVLPQVLEKLRDDTGAAIYLCSYIDGELEVNLSSFGPAIPKVNEYVPLRECVHASAVGQSILSQLPHEMRKEHLSQFRPMSLTARTITDPEKLFRKVDRYGPTGSHFDLKEYSESEVCAAIAMPLAGAPRTIALSLPADQQHRLREAAQTLSDRSAGLLLALLTAITPTSPRQPQPADPSPSGTHQALHRPAPGPAAAQHAREAEAEVLGLRPRPVPSTPYIAAHPN